MAADIDRVLEQLKPLLRHLEQTENISTKLRVDKEGQVIRIYGGGSDYVKRAHSGLADVLELAYSTAEHHPYWAVLYHATEISKTILERWDADLTSDQIGEMLWRCDEIKMVIERVARK
jgi:hypothetical protein